MGHNAMQIPTARGAGAAGTPGDATIASAATVAEPEPLRGARVGHNATQIPTAHGAGAAGTPGDATIASAATVAEREPLPSPPREHRVGACTWLDAGL